MTSYHDFKKQVYPDTRAEQYTQIHGGPSCCNKEKLSKEAHTHTRSPLPRQLYLDRPIWTTVQNYCCRQIHSQQPNDLRIHCSLAAGQLAILSGQPELSINNAAHGRRKKRLGGSVWLLEGGGRKHSRCDGP